MTSEKQMTVHWHISAEFPPLLQPIMFPMCLSFHDDFSPFLFSAPSSPPLSLALSLSNLDTYLPIHTPVYLPDNQRSGHEGPPCKPL